VAGRLPQCGRTFSQGSGQAANQVDWHSRERGAGRLGSIGIGRSFHERQVKWRWCAVGTASSACDQLARGIPGICDHRHLHLAGSRRRRGRRIWLSHLDVPADPGPSRPSGRVKSHGKSGTLTPRTASRSTPLPIHRRHQERLPRGGRHRVPLLWRCMSCLSHPLSAAHRFATTTSRQ